MSYSLLFGHQQTIHQYIVREAFKLLLKSYPSLAYSAMATYVGTNETSNPSDKSWGAEKIVSGAWIEDEEDIVYDYRDMVNWDKGLISISHFLDPDNGDSNKNTLQGTLPGMYFSIGQYPNA